MAYSLQSTYSIQCKPHWVLVSGQYISETAIPEQKHPSSQLARIVLWLHDLFKAAHLHVTAWLKLAAIAVN